MVEERRETFPLNCGITARIHLEAEPELLHVCCPHLFAIIEFETFNELMSSAPAAGPSLRSSSTF